MTAFSRILSLIVVGVALVVSMPASSVAELNQAASQPTDLPPAPTGYEWHVSTNGVGRFLKPNGWFVKEEVIKNTNALFITKHDFTASGRFDIGLTVNQINDFSKKNSIAPSVYALKFIDTLRTKKEIIKSGTVKGNKTDMHIAQIRGSNNGVMTDVHYITVGDDEKDIMYLLFFEAPEKVWEEEMKTVSPMLNIFGLGL